MLSYLERVVNWLRVGYPQGVPDGDYIPLLALLRRRLSDEECVHLGQELVRRGLVPADKVDVGVGYIRITDELPSHDELQRVMDRLREAGWQITETGAWHDGEGPSDP